MKRKERKIVVLNSGGFDSTVMIHDIRKHYPKAEIHSLFFNYGQNNASMEEYCATGNAEKVNAQSIMRITIPRIDWTKNNFYSSDLKDAPSQYLEMRNLIFLSYALSYGQSINATDIMAAFLVSHFGYDDTSPEFVKRFNEISSLVGIKFTAPYIEIEKEDIANLLPEFGIKEDDFFSCDVPMNNKPCGKCGDCTCIADIYKSLPK